MIVTFTDFGVTGPYMGQMRAVLLNEAPGEDIVDLMIDAPAFNPKASSYLLPAVVESIADGFVCVAVVDPGVGGARRPVICLLYTSPSPRDLSTSRMPSSA